ncbi:hypothetical protein M885DRAFT_540661 [Pelagophyceae sp. CCMP2097]|nr:hypothetical protein M885DRAFT_540661 [Pelagophyceae sp. CCMP2097]
MRVAGRAQDFFFVGECRRLVASFCAPRAAVALYTCCRGAARGCVDGTGRFLLESVYVWQAGAAVAPACARVAFDRLRDASEERGPEAWAAFRHVETLVGEYDARAPHASVLRTRAVGGWAIEFEPEGGVLCQVDGWASLFAERLADGPDEPCCFALSVWDGDLVVQRRTFTCVFSRAHRRHGSSTFCELDVEAFDDDGALAVRLDVLRNVPSDFASAVLAEPRRGYKQSTTFRFGDLPALAAHFSPPCAAAAPAEACDAAYGHDAIAVCAAGAEFGLAVFPFGERCGARGAVLYVRLAVYAGGAATRALDVRVDGRVVARLKHAFGLDAELCGVALDDGLLLRSGPCTPHAAAEAPRRDAAQAAGPSSSTSTRSTRAPTRSRRPPTRGSSAAASTKRPGATSTRQPPPQNGKGPSGL